MLGSMATRPRTTKRRTPPRATISKAPTKPRVIGLTGNIAAGKSTVGAFLEELGVPVIDADKVSREVTAKGAPAFEAVVEEFGKTFLDATGEIDRKKLRELVFTDPERRERLEDILHPAIQKRTVELIREAAKAGAPVIVYEAPLLIETERHKEMDGLLLVTADVERRADRLSERNPDVSPELALQMMASQMPQDEKRKLADWTIENDGTLEELRRKVEAWVGTVTKDLS